MTTAIEFNGKFCFMAVKVDYISAYWMLSAELETCNTTIPEH